MPAPRPSIRSISKMSYACRADVASSTSWLPPDSRYRRNNNPTEGVSSTTKMRITITVCLINNSNKFKLHRGVIAFFRPPVDWSRLKTGFRQSRFLPTHGIYLIQNKPFFAPKKKHADP